MGERHYKTRRQAELLAYLQQHEGEHLTVTRIGDDLRAQGVRMGVATIYRHLDQMVAAGTVQKYLVDATSGACYEYVGEGDTEAGDFLHCKCEACGRVIHLSGEELSQVRRQMMLPEGFVVDPARTVLYGLCAGCAGKRNRTAGSAPAGEERGTDG